MAIFSNLALSAVSLELEALSSAYGKPVWEESGEELSHLGSKCGLKSSSQPLQLQPPLRWAATTEGIQTLEGGADTY